MVVRSLWSSVRACHAGDAEQQPPHVPPPWQARGGCGEDSGAEEGVCNCMAVWPALSILFPSRILCNSSSDKQSLPNVSVIAVTSGVCLRGKESGQISSHHLFVSVLLYVDVWSQASLEYREIGQMYSPYHLL